MTTMTRTLMLARRMGFGRNPLRRGSDRIEVTLLWIALVASMLMMPLSAALGTSIAQADARTSAETRATGTQVVAMTLDAAPLTPSTSVAVSQPVRAVWTDATGQQRAGVVSVPQGTRAGSLIRVWLDGFGRPVETPSSSGLSAFVGAMAGIATFIGGLAGIWFLVWLTRLLLDQWRFHRWQVEWHQVSAHIRR
jgi:hypothetical protein